MRRPMAPALVAVAAILAACSGSDVGTGSATAITTAPAIATTVPLSTDAPAASTDAPTTTRAPAPTDPPVTTSSPGTVPAGDPDEPSTSSGDVLFPALGSSDLDVVSYDVRIGYDVPTQVITGAVTVTTRVRRPLDVIALDASQLVVDAVTVDGVAATFEQVEPELLVTPATPVAPGSTVVIDIEYRDDRHETQFGFGIGGGWYPGADGSYVLNEPDGARRWLPSNDHPSDKATWRFAITVADGLAAVANGRLVEQRPDAGSTTWVWEQHEPMATYLVQLLIGDYVVLDGGTAGTVPLTNVALRSDVARMQPYFDLTDDQLAFFEPLFGPYPLDRYGLAFAASVPGLAMETQGRSMFSRSDVQGDLGPTQQMFLAHELAHQWFGDAVSPADWSDLWLNESFATYGQWLWLDHVGIETMDSVTTRMLAVRQINGEATGTPSVANLFGFERYDGGAVVLHALRCELGDDVFFALLQRWVADNDGTSRSTEDFTALATELAERDLTAFFATWLFASTVPPTYPG
jgi:aminopeptidase N